MLLLADRGITGFELWREAASSTGADLLWRVRKNNIVLPVLQGPSTTARTCPRSPRPATGGTVAIRPGSASSNTPSAEAATRRSTG